MENENIFIICEGPTEVTILNILLENDKLIYSYDDLQYFEPLHIRSALEFERDYLNKDLENIKVYRIIDSRNKNVLKFKLSKAFEDKVEIINCVTSPEIEMLIIIAFGKYEEYTNKYKSKLKPNEYVKSILKISNPKNHKTIRKIFADCELLCESIKEYSRCSKKIKDVNHISCLLK